MPSGPHEWMVELFRNRPSLAAELLREALHFGALTQRVELRIIEASVAELDEIGERLLTAQTLDEALGSQ